MKLKPDLFSVAEQLRTVFRGTNTIAKAKALARGKRDGLSNRTLAGMVGHEESHVRNLLRLLELPIADQRQIEEGKPYRPYLAALTRQDKSRKKAAAEAARTAEERTAKRGSKAIMGWLETLGISGSFVEQVLMDVKALILGGEQEGILKPSKVLWSGTPEAAFAANLPANYAQLNNIDSLNAAIRCIARALVTLIPNSDVRYRAVELVLAVPSMRAKY